MIFIGTLILCSIIGYSSSLYFGKDNPIEQEAEDIIDMEIQRLMHLPDGSIDVDLTPEK
jgi:hypothetical protein